MISSWSLEEIDGYEIVIKNKHCSIYYNDIFYAHCLLVNGLYVLDLEDESIYNINANRAQPNDLNSTFIWHCRLGHISRGRIEILVKNRILPPVEFLGLEQCIDCIKRKIHKTD